MDFCTNQLARVINRAQMVIFSDMTFVLLYTVQIKELLEQFLSFGGEKCNLHYVSRFWVYFWFLPMDISG